MFHPVDTSAGSPAFNRLRDERRRYVGGMPEVLRPTAQQSGGPAAAGGGLVPLLRPTAYSLQPKAYSQPVLTRPAGNVIGIRNAIPVTVGNEHDVVKTDLQTERSGSR